MTDQQLLKRISWDPKIMVGKPVIQGTRLTVEYVLNLLAHGSTNEAGSTGCPNRCREAAGSQG